MQIEDAALSSYKLPFVNWESEEGKRYFEYLQDLKFSSDLHFSS